MDTQEHARRPRGAGILRWVLVTLACTASLGAMHARHWGFVGFVVAVQWAPALVWYYATCAVAGWLLPSGPRFRGTLAAPAAIVVANIPTSVFLPCITWARPSPVPYLEADPLVPWLDWGFLAAGLLLAMVVARRRHVPVTQTGDDQAMPPSV